MFSNLRQGAIVYIFEKGDKYLLHEAQVTAVSNPRPKYNNPANYLAGAEMVLDFEAKSGEQSYKFNGVSANSNFNDNGSVFVSDNKEAMQQEVYNTQQNSKNIVESRDYHLGVIEQCEEILKQLSPVYAQQQRYDEEISSLRKGMDELKDMLTQLVSAIPKKGNTK